MLCTTKLQMHLLPSLHKSKTSDNACACVNLLFLKAALNEISFF